MLLNGGLQGIMTNMNSEAKIEDFSNNVLVPEALPTLTDIQFLSISPRYRLINVVVALGTCIIIAMILTAVRFQPFFSVPEQLTHLYPYALMGVTVLAILWAVYHVFADVKIKYGMREQDLSLQKGLVFRQQACQPILRVQHVEIKRGPIIRLAKLASLQVFSAGGEYHTFEIPGLPLERAEQLRQFILDHKDVSAK